jgi:hypothetical protein
MASLLESLEAYARRGIYQGHGIWIWRNSALARGAIDLGRTNATSWDCAELLCGMMIRESDWESGAERPACL